MSECTLFNSCYKGHTHCCCECQDEDRAGCICTNVGYAANEMCEHLNRTEEDKHDKTQE